MFEFGDGVHTNLCYETSGPIRRNRRFGIVTGRGREDAKMVKVRFFGTRRSVLMHQSLLDPMSEFTSEQKPLRNRLLSQRARGLRIK